MNASNTKSSKHKDLDFLKVIAEIKPAQFAAIEPYLQKDAIDVICGFFNYLLSNPSAEKFGQKKKKIAKLLKQNKELLKNIAGCNTAGKHFNRKRKVLMGSGFPLIPILSAAIPAIIALLKK